MSAPKLTKLQIHALKLVSSGANQLYGGLAKYKTAVLNCEKKGLLKVAGMMGGYKISLTPAGAEVIKQMGDK
jgi:hypothetical protein